MSSIGTLARQSSHYFIGRVAVMIAGFVSFPILTRIFSVGDYGLLGLLNTTLFLVIAVTKLGFPNAIVRFFEEYRKEEKLSVFYSTMFWGSTGAAALTAIGFAVVVWLAGDRFWDEEVAKILSLFPLLVFAVCTMDTITSFLRAEQRTKLYNAIGILRRYGSLILGISLAVFLVKGLFGFFLGHLISAGVFLVLMGYAFRGKVRIERGALSALTLLTAVRFGFPLVWAELGDLVLNYADRYLVEIYLGRESLGLYTAGYNLATYVTAAVIQPINYAMTPIYMRILVEQGEAETKEFFRTLLRGFVLFTAPLACILIAGGRDLILFLASSKYAEASNVLGYVVVGQALYASTLIINCGLFIGKKTEIVTYLMVFVCVMNVGLNVLLIPRFGIIGAAQATLISYLLYGIAITYFSFRQFRFPVDYGYIVLYLALSFATYLVIRGIHLRGSFETLMVKGTAGVALYAGMVVWLDREVRKKCMDAWDAVRRRGKGERG